MTEYRPAEKPCNPKEKDNIDSWPKILLTQSHVGFKPPNFDIFSTEVDGYPRPDGMESFIKWHLRHNRLVKV